MGLLNRLADSFLGSNLELTKPNFEKAPLLKFDFSGNIVTLNSPPHTAMFPVAGDLQSLDIFNNKNFEIQEEGDSSIRFYVRGWDLKGRGSKVIGGVKVSGILLNFTNITRPEYSCTKDNDFKAELLRYCHDIWGHLNKASAVGDIGSGKYQYPLSKSEVKSKVFSGDSWSEILVSRKGVAPVYIYARPLTSHHIVLFDFTVTSYDSIDYFSPETNIKEACESVVDDFMKNVQIENLE